MNQNLKLLIIGDGPDKEKYERLTKDKNCENNIIFTGKVPWDKVPIYYHISDAFVTASTSETQGLTVIEAMAASLPAICINDDSFNNTVVDGLNGYLFETKEECADIIVKVMNDKKLRASLASGARTSADGHSSGIFAERVLRVYEKAIQNKKITFRERISNWLKRGNS